MRALLFALIGVAACGSARAGDSFHLDESAAIVVNEAGVDGKDSDACRAFRLDEEQVRAYFAKAMAITRRDRRKHFRRAPCLFAAR